ncbi:MAG: hypothetical protein RLT05_03760 [Bauldia litoralis]
MILTATSAMHDAELQGILDFVERYSRAHGFPPSYAEIAEACGLGSVGHVQYRVNRLIREGRLMRSPGRARSLVVAPRMVDERPTTDGEQNRIKWRLAALLKAILAPVRG